MITLVFIRVTSYMLKSPKCKRKSLPLHYFQPKSQFPLAVDANHCRLKKQKHLSRAWSAEKSGSRSERDDIFRRHGAKSFQCSGEVPCTQCTSKAHVCIIDPRTDRRRRSHFFELSQGHRALESTVAQLRHETPDEVKSLILTIRSFKTDREATTYLVRKYT